MRAGIFCILSFTFSSSFIFFSILKLVRCAAPTTPPHTHTATTSTSSTSSTKHNNHQHHHHHRGRRHKLFRSNPYDILHVDPTTCTQKEIQRQYRALCLQFHPDKKKNQNVTIDTNDDDELTYEKDFEFKEVQHAFSLIGTEEDRRNYDLLQKYNSLSTHHHHHHHHGAFSRRYPTTTSTTDRNGWQHQQKNMRQEENIMLFGPSTIYFTVFGDGLSFRFTHRRHPPPPSTTTMFSQFRQGMQHPHDYNGKVRSQASSNMRPHYIQRVTIPLEVLYNGGRDMELTLKTSIVDRYRAAYHGGILIPVILQSSLTILATWLRSQKINWPLSLFLFVFMIHINIPAPPTKVTYKTAIKKGWKGGTKIKYQTDVADITFVLQEDNHGTYSRVGNDLHTLIKVSSRQLRKGCTLTVPPLCESDAPIQFKLRPNEVGDGDTITIKSRGWPISGVGQKDEYYGDLKVKICRNTRKYDR